MSTDAEISSSSESSKSSDDALQAVFVGRAIRKQFPGMGSFSGKVTGFDSTERLWQVTYDDGDQEELEEAELLPILVAETKKRPNCDADAASAPGAGTVAAKRAKKPAAAVAAVDDV